MGIEKAIASFLANKPLTCITLHDCHVISVLQLKSKISAQSSSNRVITQLKVYCSFFAYSSRLSKNCLKITLFYYRMTCIC